MTEKEKMIAGLNYNAGDPELVKDRAFAKTILSRYNRSLPRQAAKRRRLLERLFRKRDVAVWIEPPFYCDYGYNIETGEHFYANHNCVLLDVCPIKLGSHVLLGPAVQIYTAAHPLDPASRNSGEEFGKPVTVGDNVWIGGGSVILPGVTIGSNTTIGAGSVVTKDIPANCVAAGNPCRVIRNI